MPERDDALETYLQDLRRSASLSVAQVCERTKIQARYVEALEEGRFGEVPSNTHLRAFSLSIAQACGGDAERCALLVRRVLAASAPTTSAPRSFDTPAPAPAEAVKAWTPAVPAPVDARPSAGGAPRLAVEGPALTRAAATSALPTHGLAAASARLRSLPLGLLLGLLALAAIISYSAAWGLDQWRHKQAQQAIQAPVEAVEAAAKTDAADKAAPANSPGPAPAVAAAASADAALAPTTELVLRARRPCWLVLEIDGERLPTVTLQDGDKLRWPVKQRAKLLAGNVGALRVWWRGDNLGYLGELGVRANALVFDRGKAPRMDQSQALALPPGVPE